jgi:hypothetical protein
MQIDELSLEVSFVVLPSQPVYPGSGIAFEREERQPKKIDTDVVKERGEPFLLPLPCNLSYAVQRL